MTKIKYMTAKEVRQKFFDFFEKRGHKLIPSASLVPENDPTTLFTSSGMQPLIPYLLGQPHPEGKCLADSQPSFRSQDIEEVGDNRHTTFFEMLGNWSLGDYFKREQLQYFFTFLTDKKEGLGLDPEKIYVSVFAGNKEVAKDTESIEIWKKLFSEKGIEAKEDERIFLYGVDKNWWSRSGTPEQMPIGEIGGPDSEIYYDFGLPHDPRFGEKCHPACDCGRFLEIGNSVFIQYQKQEDGSLKELPQKNVDFGGGLERLTAAVNNNPDIFQIDLYSEGIKTLEAIKKTSLSYKDNPRIYRIILDHLRAAIFIAAEGVEPSNKERGYILRRLLRRAMVNARKLGMEGDEWLSNLVFTLSSPYVGIYPQIADKIDIIYQVLNGEVDKFRITIDNGLRRIEKADPDQLNTLFAFDLFQTYGFPVEITRELFVEKGKIIDQQQFEEIFRKHQDLSRTTSASMFKGGLADHSEVVTKYHTATHLLHQALRQVLGDQVHQIGSNITSERARFDFTYPEKLTEEQIHQVEEIINEKIKENLPVTMQIMTLEQAKKEGALAFFAEKYGQQVKVFSVGTFSKEVCGGPHVKYTGELNDAKIIKEEAVGAGKRRIYLTLG